MYDSTSTEDHTKGKRRMGREEKEEEGEEEWEENENTCR